MTCNIPGFHYHVFASKDQLPDSFKSTASKPFSITCLFNCFQLLVRTKLTKTSFCGEKINRIDKAVN